VARRGLDNAADLFMQAGATHKSFEFTLTKACVGCGDPLPLGLARCRNPGCLMLRPEFVPHAKVVGDVQGRCLWSKARTDVRLPNGDYLWAPYFLDAYRAGWIDASYAYTPLFVSALRSRGVRKADRPTD
jgi:hypothetical protein